MREGMRALTLLFHFRSLARVADKQSSYRSEHRFSRRAWFGVTCELYVSMIRMNAEGKQERR